MVEERDMKQTQQRQSISILIPCHNEEAGVRACIESCLNQTRKLDQIVVVDDASTDKSLAILKEFGNKITLIALTKNMGNKSYVQEHGLQHITSDIFIATDGDTILDPHFVEEIEKSFVDDKVIAAGGYIRSIKYNWITAIREIDYVVGQNIHKLAQSHMDSMLVIPGCAGAFRTSIFKKHITFDHDTITEDLDFTYRFHRNGFKIAFNRNAIVWTQDPPTFHSYLNQMRRWYGGGWQNLRKHYGIVSSPLRAIEWSLIYVEGLVFSTLLLVMPLLNIKFFCLLLIPYALFDLAQALYTAWKSRRMDVIYYAPLHLCMVFVNAYVFIEQFVKEIILRKRTMIWFKPLRVHI